MGQATLAQPPLAQGPLAQPPLAQHDPLQHKADIHPFYFVLADPRIGRPNSRRKMLNVVFYATIWYCSLQKSAALSVQ